MFPVSKSLGRNIIKIKIESEMPKFVLRCIVELVLRANYPGPQNKEVGTGVVYNKCIFHSSSGLCCSRQVYASFDHQQSSLLGLILLCIIVGPQKTLLATEFALMLHLFYEP